MNKEEIKKRIEKINKLADQIETKEGMTWVGAADCAREIQELAIVVLSELDKPSRIMKENSEKTIRDPDRSLHMVERCSLCNREFSIHEFRDAVNLEEFGISGLCQECQDKTSEEGK